MRTRRKARGVRPVNELLEPPDPYEMGMSDAEFEELERNFWAEMPEPTGEVAMLATVTMERPVAPYPRVRNGKREWVDGYLRKTEVEIGDPRPVPVKKASELFHPIIEKPPAYLDDPKLGPLFFKARSTGPPPAKLKSMNVKELGDMVLERAKVDPELDGWLDRMVKNNGPPVFSKAQWDHYVNHGVSAFGVRRPRDAKAQWVYYEVSRYQDAWAQGTDNHRSRRLQHSVVKMFGHDVVKSHDREFSADEANPMSDALVQAMYDRTQRFLREAGIEKVSVFRGMGFVVDDPEEPDPPLWVQRLKVSQTKKKVRASLNPLSSWSVDREIGSGFSTATDYDVGVILVAEFPVERILAVPMTGIGCLYEEEVVVMGGDEKFEMTAVMDW